MDDLTLEERVKGILHGLFPDQAIETFTYRALWYKHVFRAGFDDGTAAYLKMPNSDAPDIGSVEQEAAAIRFLRNRGIAQPPVVALDATRAALPLPYLVTEAGCGIPLGRIVESGDTCRIRQAYRATGVYFSRFAGIENGWAGVWDTVPERRKYPVHPAEAMYHLEIEEGSGRKAHEAGALPGSAYKTVKALWREHMPMLTARPAVLTQYSAFPWSIYLNASQDGYEVSKLTALCDILWWDIDMTVAQLLYPPFTTPGDDARAAFLEGYGRPVSRACVALYGIMNRLCAWAGVYAEPESAANGEWRAQCLEDVDRFIGMIS